MSDEIVIETLDTGRHSNAYRGERALVCAIIEDVLEEIQYERVDRNIHGRHDITDSQALPAYGAGKAEKADGGIILG